MIDEFDRMMHDPWFDEVRQRGGDRPMTICPCRIG